VRENEKLFHSRIFRIYLEYLRISLGWTERRIDSFLEEIGITRERLEDESSWFDVEFADDFYLRLRDLTGDADLAYHAGIFIHRKTASPIFHQLLRGLLDVTFVYRLVAKFSAYFSKAAQFSVVSVGTNSAQIDVVPVKGFEERPYMCENRRGMLSGVPLVFGLEAAQILESECIHRGGHKCTYSLKWQRTSQFVPIIRNHSAAVVFGILTGQWFGPVTGISVFFLGAFLAGLVFLEKKFSEQKQELLNQYEALDQTLREIERKNRQLELVNHIAQLTHSRTSPRQLSETVVRNVCEILNYDRSILLSVEPHRQVLLVSAHFGFDQQMKELLEQAEFNIRSDNSEGFFVRVVNTNAPVLISDVPAHLTKLSPRSQKFAKILGSQSFVAVPLTDENKEVVGVLSVDNVHSARKIDITDQDLLMTLSDHLGIALHNSKLMGQLEENLERTKTFSEQQRLLREAFQKFVPTDVVTDLSGVSSSELFKRHLAQVKNRFASILFLDVFNFSKLAEKMRPEDIVDLLNTAFEIFEPIISRHRGFVDKFTGDGLMAIFEDSESSVGVCLAARALIESMQEVNEKLTAKSYPEIAIGIGINFGPVILGNIGSPERLNFTVIGEAVNLASRLESHTRTMGPNTICASPGIRSRAGELISWKDLGAIHIKGYPEPLQAFELLAEKGEGTSSGERGGAVNV
jgi:class 3 adenylate cyclase